LRFFGQARRAECPDRIGVADRERHVAAEQHLAGTGPADEELDAQRVEGDGVVEQPAQHGRRRLGHPGPGQQAGPGQAVEPERLVGQEPAAVDHDHAQAGEPVEQPVGHHLEDGGAGVGDAPGDVLQDRRGERLRRAVPGRVQQHRQAELGDPVPQRPQ